MLTYLCLAISSQKEDSSNFFDHEITWEEGNSTSHKLYIISLQPTIHSKYNGVWIWEDGEKKQVFRVRHKNWEIILRDCLTYICNRFSQFDGFIYSGHSGTVNVGSWFRDHSPFFKLSDLISIFIEYQLTFPVMVFSSCYMGGWISLLEYSRITQWVCADPGYSSWNGITATSMFWKRKKSTPIGMWLQQAVTEYHKRYPKDRYKCYMVFDIRYVEPIFKQMKRVQPMEWAWKPRNRLSIHDKTTYDLYSVLTDNETEQNQYVKKMTQYIQKMMRYSIFNCSKDNKKGPSIQWGRIRHVEDRYEGTRWWDHWKDVNTKTIAFKH